MFPITTMPMPGALRLRALHPLIEGDGSCSLIYDLERAAVVEVPEDLQFHIAPALETGDLDEALLGWLVNEDLLTSEGGAGWSVAAGAVRPAGGGGGGAWGRSTGSTTSSTSASTRRARTPPWRWWGSCSSRASAPAGSSCI